MIQINDQSAHDDLMEDHQPFMAHLNKMDYIHYEPSVMDENDLDIFENGEPVEVPFADIHRDSYFGELALADGLRDKRLFSLWAVANSHLFYFDRNDFRDMLKKQEQRIIAERISFLNHIPLLKMLSYS